MRSKAAQLIDVMPGTQEEKAARFQTTQGTLSRWCAGPSTPRMPQRARIFEAGGPPPEAWDEFDTAGQISPPQDRAEPGPVVAATPEGTRKSADEILAMINDEINVLKANPVDETPGGRVRALAQLAQAAKSLGGLTGDGLMSEAMILKSPAWRELQRVILGALEAHPIALGAVIEALESRQVAP